MSWLREGRGSAAHDTTHTSFPALLRGETSVRQFASLHFKDDVARRAPRHQSLIVMTLCAPVDHIHATWRLSRPRT